MLASILITLLGFTSASYEGAGVQLFRGGTEVLLVQGMKSGKWGFPKGHRELGDMTWKETAIREVIEETGYVYGIHYRLCEEEETARWGSRIYWRGYMICDDPPRHNVTEHRGLKWFPKNVVQDLKITRDVEEWVTFDYSLCSK